MGTGRRAGDGAVDHGDPTTEVILSDPPALQGLGDKVSDPPALQGLGDNEEQASELC